MHAHTHSRVQRHVNVLRVVGILLCLSGVWLQAVCPVCTLCMIYLCFWSEKLVERKDICHWGYFVRVFFHADVHIPGVSLLHLFPHGWQSLQLSELDIIIEHFKWTIHTYLYLECGTYSYVALLILIYDPYVSIPSFLFCILLYICILPTLCYNCRSIIPLRMSKVRPNLSSYLSLNFFLRPAVGTFGVYSKADI